MAINRSIFKAYDIRGIAPAEFSDGVCERVAVALVAMTSAKCVVLGHDARTSSPELLRRVLDGLLSTGVEIIDIGLCTTPMFNFAVASDSSVGAGIMVTASHNPPQYNGLKMVSAGARPVGGIVMLEAVEALPSVMLSKAKHHEGRDPSPGLRMTTARDVVSEYLNAILKLSSWDPAWAQVIGNIVIDCGNGMVGVPLPHFLERTALDARVLFGEVDCSFPNHEANPVKESTLADLKRAVVADHAAFGVAFDGDADRVGFVDEHGERIAGDHIGALIAEELMEPSALVFGDVNAGWAFREIVERAGGTFELTKVGHANIKQVMRERRGLFAAELSYHFYYRDFFNVESTLLTLLLLAKRFAREGKSMSELVAPYRKYFASGEINFEVHDAAEILIRVREAFEKYSVRVFDFDGLRMEFSDGWFSLRASNTEPMLRLNIEATTRERMEGMRARIQHLCK